MKKLFLLLALMVLASNSWATPDQAKPVEVSGSQAIKASAGMVYSVSMSYIGATAGDNIKLKDSLSDTGNILFTCVASASSGTCISNFTVAAYFGTGIYYKESKTGAATIVTDIQYF